MKPPPFRPEPIPDRPDFVRDRGPAGGGLVWHRCDYRTLYADTDRSRAVYHANYLRYFEVGRTALMREAAYPYREIEAGGFIYPIIQVGVDYYRPLRYDDTMLIYTRPGVLERVKLQFDYRITHGETGELVCTGFTRHCATNAAGVPVGVDEKTRLLWDTFPR